MTDDEDPGYGRMLTHVRALAYDAAPLPTPEIRALARIDIEVDTVTVAHGPPFSRRFATLADKRTDTCGPCTPAILAQTIWTPTVPAVLIAWGAATWRIFGPALTLGVARIDLQKAARLAWPDQDVRDPVGLATRAGLHRPPTTKGQTIAEAAADKVQAMAELFGVIVILAGDDMVARAASLAGQAGQAPHDAILGALRGDRRIEALVRLSAEPMPPLDRPAPWDDESWPFAMSDEDLNWYVGATPGTLGYDSYVQDEARVELARRREHDAALKRPRGLLRQIARD